MNRRDKTIYEMKQAEIDMAVLVSSPNVIYSSGFEVPYSPAFMGDMSKGLPMMMNCISAGTGAWCLVASDFYRTKLERAGYGDVSYFRSFTHTETNEVKDNFKAALMKAVEKSMEGYRGRKGAAIRIGIEKEVCPVCVTEILKEIYPEAEFSDISGAMGGARLIKTPEEISILKKAAAASDAAQERLYEIAHTEGDYTELDIWFEVQKAVSAQTKKLTPFVGELVTGPRAGLSDYPLGPTDRKVERGDIAIMDISPRVEGYWGDCSNVVVFWDKPNEEQNKYFAAVKDAYEAGRDIIRPGVRFVDVNRRMEEMYEKHGFRLTSYLGHQIGASVNELPRFTLCEEAVLMENMVVCIEPQIYTGDKGKTGVRLEKMLHVTKDGAEELNHFRWGI